jgi:hypothetical protein
MTDFTAARAVVTRSITVRADCHRAVQPSYGGPRRLTASVSESANLTMWSASDTVDAGHRQYRAGGVKLVDGSRAGRFVDAW